jgi:fatty-acyl-CoA synthase
METFSRRFWRTYAEAPERLAVILQRAGEPDLPLTYRAIVDGAYGYAQVLAKEGVQAGEIVILILQHGPELVLAYWGTILAGAVPSIMPFLTEKLSPERYRADLTALIEVTKPRAIVTYREFAPELRAAPNGEGPAIILADKVDRAPSPEFHLLPGMSRRPEDVALLQHSSGSTGLQKGVALSHRAVLNQLETYASAIRLQPESDVIVSWLPLYHDMGLIAGFIMPILMRVPLVLLSPFDWVRAPYRLMQAVSQYRGTLTWLPNFAYNFCAEMIRPRHMEGVDLSSWRAIINCSEPVRAESHDVFYARFAPHGLRQQALQTCYAMAENVFGVSQSPLEGLPATLVVQPEPFISERVVKAPGKGQSGLRLMSSGRPLPNVELRVVNDRGGELTEGEIGEIALRSNCMLTGYYNRPDATEKAFRDGWFLTGDYGFVFGGEVFVTGRKKDVIIIGGKNIYPQDLEVLAAEVPGVHAGRVVAFGVFNESAGTEEVVILAELDQAARSEMESGEAIRAYVTKNSAVAVRTVEIVPRGWVMKTSSGKLARGANKEKYLRAKAGTK